MVFDIGVVLTSKNSVLESVKALSDHEKYKIFKNHYKADSMSKFSPKEAHGCIRQCKLEYLHGTFVYSQVMDSVFCLCCALFVPYDNRKTLGAFVNKGYSHWNNILEKEGKHSQNMYHKDAAERATELVERFERPANTIPALVTSTLSERHKKYPEILGAIARVVHLLGKQGLAFRGHREKMTDTDELVGNPGNFIAFLREIANYYPDLEEHMMNAVRKKTTYLSPQSQNEMIDIIGTKMIQEKLIREIKSSGYHSILADEVTSSNDQILSISMRYVNCEREIREVFVQFLDLKRITGEFIGKTITDFYKKVGIDIEQCKGQCYDGAPNMQSEVKGTAHHILKLAPKAAVTHCSSHNFNLCLSASCKLPIIDNVIEQYKSVTIYFNISPKRENLLQHVVEENCQNQSRRKVLIGMCKTRWSERDQAYEHFYLALPYIVESLEVINGTHANLELFSPIFREGWSPKDKREATAHLCGVANFEFIVGIISLYRLLHPLVGVTQRLQGRAADVVSAYQDVDSCLQDIQAVRASIDKEFSIIYQQAERMGVRVGAEPVIPRTAKRQMHRNNIEANSAEEYYRRAIAIPLLDHFIAEVKFRFNKLSKTASNVLLLVPSILCSSESSDFASLTEEYKSDLPNADVVDLEIRTWRRKWSTYPSEERPSSLASAIKMCDEKRYPNLFVLLKLGCTLPVTSCECERSFSTIRRLRTWLRSSTTTERLSSLAIMNIHREQIIDYDEAVKLFLTLHPRKIEQSNLIFE